MAKVMNKVVERSAEAKAAQARGQEAMARRWLGGSHLTEVARECGVGVATASTDVAWGLLRLGEVDVSALVDHGFHTVKRRAEA